MDRGIGEGKTRGDHADTAIRLIAAYSSGRAARELLANLGESAGESALTAAEQRFAQFADEFEKRYVSQGDADDRSIEETLNLGLELLATLGE
jgi:V/A-type H+-transporting ATPase subunit B